MNKRLTKADKVKLLNEILAGKASIHDGEPIKYKIEMWMDDPDDPDYLIGINDKTMRESKKDHKERVKRDKTWCVTMVID